MRCLAKTKAGRQCKNDAVSDTDFCPVHTPSDLTPPPGESVCATPIGNEEHIALVKRPVAEIAEWRIENPGVQLDLRRADLSEFDFSDADLTEANLSGANLRDASFRHANLSRADLTDVEGLIKDQLAGTNLAHATLPQSITAQALDQMADVNDAARRTRTLFSAMLVGCVYSWLTIWATRDVELITNNATSTLPIIATDVPIVGFFIVAPVLLLATYVYFQVCLQRMWDKLSVAPAVFPDGESIDSKTNSWILLGFVRSHFPQVTSRPPMSSLQDYLSISLAWLIVPATMVVFWVRYVTRHEWSGTLLHIAVVVYSLHLAGHTLRQAATTLSGCRFTPNWRIRLAVICFGVILGIASWIGIESSMPPNVWRANLVDAEVSTKPAGAFDTLIGSFGKLLNENTDLVRDGLTESVDDTFQEVALRFVEEIGSNINAASWTTRARLKGANLRFATASGAFLAGADLRGTDLTGAELRGAFLMQADFGPQQSDGVDSEAEGASLREADLSKADLFGANLRFVDLSRARVRSSNLRFADLRGARLTGADPSNADLRSANLTDADLSGAILSEVSLDRACVDSRQWFDKLEELEPKPIGLSSLRRGYRVVAVIENDTTTRRWTIRRTKERGRQNENGGRPNEESRTPAVPARPPPIESVP